MSISPGKKPPTPEEIKRRQAAARSWAIDQLDKAIENNAFEGAVPKSVGEFLRDLSGALLRGVFPQIEVDSNSHVCDQCRIDCIIDTDGVVGDSEGPPGATCPLCGKEWQLDDAGGTEWRAI